MPWSVSACLSNPSQSTPSRSANNFGSERKYNKLCWMAVCLAMLVTARPQVEAQAGHAHTRGHVSTHITGTDGSQTGTASFFGNFTSIETPSGALAMGRYSDCSLGLATGTYTINSAGLTYTETGLTTHYEQVLHRLAQLTTTPNVFPNGCALQPPLGFGSEPGVFVGTTTKGIRVFAGLGLVSPSFQNGVYLLTGTNTFTITSFAFATAGDLTAADVNGDGNGDLIISNMSLETSSHVTVMLGKDDGTFGTAVTYPTAGNYTVAATIDDVTGDKIPDIIAVSGDQQISVLPGKGDGTFGAAVSFTAPTLPGYTAGQAPITNLVTADLRSRGKRDLIASNGLVFLGNGDGTFLTAATPAFPYEQSNLTSYAPLIAAGDFNKDGKPDVVLSMNLGVSTWLGNGDGSFTAGSAYDTVPTDGFVTVSDLDGDGNPDIYIGLGDGAYYGGDEGSPTQAYALMGSGNGKFQGAPLLGGGRLFNGKNLADVNGDGIEDLVTPTASSKSLDVALGSGKGTFTTSATITFPASFTLDGNAVSASSASISDVALGDVNGDGKADIAFVLNGLTYNNGTAEYGSPVYFSVLGNGDGTFGTPSLHEFSTIIPPGGNNQAPLVSGLQIADFNHDGKGDVLFSFTTPGGIGSGAEFNQGFVIYPGNGAGSFGSAIVTYTYQSAGTTTNLLMPQVGSTADLNGDGVPDLIAVSVTGYSSGSAQSDLQVFLGKGDGTFNTPATVNCAANPIQPTPLSSAPPFVLVDLNKDGKLDLACVGETTAGQGELAIALGNGSGGFGAPTILNMPGGDPVRQAPLTAADFDGDGNIDLAFFNNTFASGIFYGKGDGTFTSVNVGNGYAPKDLINLSAGLAAVAVDLNGDGKPDILSGAVELLNVYGAAPSTGEASQTALTATPTTAAAGASVSFTATVSAAAGGTGTPTGSVTFVDGTTTLGSANLASGTVTYSTTSLAAGSHSVSAVYSGDSNFSGSTSTAVTVTINAAPALTGTTTALSASATTAVTGTSLTFNAQVKAASGSTVPSGTVTFAEGTTSLGTGTLNGSGAATFSTSSLAVGTHAITASYGGSTVFATSVSTALTITITAPAADFSLAISPASGTESSAAPATATLTVSPTNGFNASVSFACTGLPAGTSCAFSPSTVQPSGSAVTTKVTIAASASAGASLDWFYRNQNWTISLAGCGGFFLFAIRRRRSVFSRVVAGIMFVAVASAWGCGGSGSSKTAPSTVTITASAGSTTHSVSFTLTQSK